MRIVNLNESFSNIGTVVFYKHHPYIPENFDDIDDPESVFKSDLVKYHGSRDNFPGINFAEYDFSYIIEKYKFSNRLFLSDLDSSSLDLIGKNIESTDKVEKVLFPTLVNEDLDTPYDFFGSLSINGRDLYFLECPENYQIIEIYEDILTSNVPGGDGFLEYDYLKISGVQEVISPAVVIYLGPGRDVYNNPTEFYYLRDPLRSRVERKDTEYTTLEYSRLCDEIFSSKVISFFLSTSGRVLDINLSWACWENNDNPERNKLKYEIRNDQFYDILRQPQEITETSGDITVDKKSGTILGNTLVDSKFCPILSDKISRLQRTQAQNYSPYRTYRKGDTAIYRVNDRNYLYESLVNGNIGNDPLLNPAWILKDRFLDFLNSIIYISQNPASGNSTINPGTQITVKSSSQVTFDITDGLGWMLSGVHIINPETQETTELIDGEDYTYTLVDNDRGFLKTIEINSWSQFLNPESPKYTKNLVFDFTERPCIIKFMFRKDGVTYKYSDWMEEYGDNFGMTLRLNGEIIEPPSETVEYSPISYDSGDMFLFIDNPQLNPTLRIEFSGGLLENAIKSKYTQGSRKESKIIDVVSGIARDKVDFSDAEYIIEVSSIERYLIVRSGMNVTSNTQGLVTIDNGSSRTIRFTTTQDYVPSIDLINFWYDSNNRIVKYDNELHLSTIPSEADLLLSGNQTAHVTLDQLENGEYYLTVSEVVDNLMIQIEAIKIED